MPYPDEGGNSTPAWFGQANCRGVNPDLFFPTKGDDSCAAAAKAVCQTCVVRCACLDHALEHCELHGVWGGLTAEERRLLRAARRHLHLVAEPSS